MCFKPPKSQLRKRALPSLRAAVAAGIAGSIFTFATTRAAQPSPIFDWNVREPGGYDGTDPAPGVIMYTADAGHDYPALDPTTTNTYTYQASRNWPVSFFLETPDVAPTASNASNAATVSDTLNWLNTNNVPLNYVMEDFEPYNGNTQADVVAQVDSVVNLVRASPSANIKNAYVGNYADYPGGPNNSLYLSSGMTLAMPNAYPYASYETASGNPNARSALFWTPLNMISTSELNLPAGNQMVVWLSSYIEQTGYADTPPTVEDNVALIADTRLRGANGYFDLGGLVSYTYAWTDLNWIYDGTGNGKILNLTTNQSSGFQWSGYSNGGNAAFMFDNLGNSASSVSLPTITGVPASSPTVPAGTHVEIFYANDPAHIGSDSINLGRDNINSSLLVNTSVSLANAIIVQAPAAGDSPVVTIGSDLAGSNAPVFAGTISLGDNVVLQSAAATTTFFGAISGSGLVTKTGSGTVILTAGNSYSGGTNISTGALLITNSNALGTGRVAILAGGTSTASLQLSGGITITNSFAGLISETGGYTPTIENISGSNTITAPLAITSTGGNGAIFQSDAGTLNLSGGLSTTLPSSRIYYLQGAGNGRVLANITDSSADILQVIKNGTGTWTLSGTDDTYAAGTTVSGGTLVFASPGALPLFSRLSISGIAIAANHQGSATNTLFASSLTLAGSTNDWTGKLDLTDNDLVVRNGSLGTLTMEVRQGYGAANWQGSGGILSSAAAADTTHLTALGVIQDSIDQNGGTALVTTFDGQPVLNTDVLVKYTYYGDANLDGSVDGSDYSRIDNGDLNHLTGWYNGDFNYDGVIDGSDYTLIDNTFNTQGASFGSELANSAAKATSQIAGSPTSPVPEPGKVVTLTIGVIGVLGRYRRTMMKSTRLAEQP
jgi:autotransporter-associated beta strand protein